MVHKDHTRFLFQYSGIYPLSWNGRHKLPMAFGSSPGYFSGILDPQVSEASEIYSADGKMIGKFFNENRTPVKYDEVAPSFFKALVDTEDERFISILVSILSVCSVP